MSSAKSYISVALIVGAVIAMPFIQVGCASADKVLAGAKLNCDPVKHETLLQMEVRAMACCMKFMSSRTGSDSKDAVCGTIVNDLADAFKKERRKALINWCFGVDDQGKRHINVDKERCWEKIQ